AGVIWLIGAVEVELLRHTRVIVKPQRRSSRRSLLEPLERQLPVHVRLNPYLKKRIVVEPGIASRHCPRRCPVVGVILGEIDPTLDERIHPEWRGTARERQRGEGNSRKTHRSSQRIHDVSPPLRVR